MEYFFNNSRHKSVYKGELPQNCHEKAASAKQPRRQAWVGGRGGSIVEPLQFDKMVKLGTAPGPYLTNW